MPPIAARAIGAGHRYRSGRVGIHVVDLEFQAGQIAALIGPNGAGKTTLLRMLTGGLDPTEGRVDLYGSSDADVETTYGDAESVHFDELSGAANADFFARAAGLTHTAARSRVRDLMSCFGLSDDAGARVGEYSFGMRRKLLLTEVLTPTADLIAIDEPTLGLDPEARDALASLIESRAEAGCLVLVATNDLDFAAVTATRLVLIDRGRIIADASPEELLATVEGVTRLEVMLRYPLDSGFIAPDGVRMVSEGETLVFETEIGSAALPTVSTALLESGAEVLKIDVREPGLGEVFRQLTGKELER